MCLICIIIYSRNYEMAIDVIQSVCLFNRSSSLHEAMPLEKIAAIKAKRLAIKRTKIKGKHLPL